MADFEMTAHMIVQNWQARRPVVSTQKEWRELCAAIATALAEAVAGEREALAQSRVTLRAAREEIQWWVNEHRCCQGHEFEALAKIEDALGE